METYMFKFKKSAAALSVAACLSFSMPIYAGNNDGQVSGNVLNSAEMAVAGATIQIKNPKTGLTRSVVAGNDGSFRFSILPIGNYTITISKDGFDTEVLENVAVRIGETEVTASIFEAGLERISVTGSNISVIDTSSAESALNIGAIELSRIPLARNSTEVALLAPGTTRGDSGFGNLASFGGSSVAENAYFINGLNVTDFRNGLGGSTIPFEFYKEFQVKTGGYSAEFGRSTGGVINAVTKSGSNDWEYGANVFFNPDSLRETQPNSLRRDGTPLIWNADDKFSKVDANIYLSGPLIKDTLFFYLLYNPRDIESEYVSGGGNTYNVDTSDSAFWGGKIDWNITDNHIVEFTGFSDKRETVSVFTDYDYVTGEIDTFGEPALTKRGGENVSLKYTGYITDDFSISALWGENQSDLTDQSPNDENCPAIYDGREGALVALGCWSNLVAASGQDTREVFRIDGEYVLDDHTIRFGYDSETNTSTDKTFYSGNIYYRYYNSERSGGVIAGTAFDQPTEAVRVRVYDAGGEFETLSNAFYIEDVWSVTDDLTLRLGIRNESFDNENSEGASFIKVENQWAPRLSAAWDVNGDGESKLYVNYGRYHLPIAANTNIRLAGAELFTEDYYLLDSLKADDTPNFDPSTLFQGNVYGDGTVPDVREVLDSTIKPMYQDEFILGYQMMLNDDWSLETKFTTRDLASVIDDITIDNAIFANDWDYHGNVYLLTNPGTSIETYYDTDGDGTIEPVSISGESLGYPDPKRKYHSVEVSLERAWDDVWSLRASYVWAHSYGNAEGSVKSDNDQDDAGLTTDWDFPALMDGASGNLPNDRRHTIKAYGTYQLSDDWRVGANVLVQSGRPLNGFGLSYPQDADWADYGYGQTYYRGDGTFAPRGSYGRMPWIFQIDLNATYLTEIAGADVTLAVDVFNILGGDIVTGYDEDAESTVGGASETFLLPTGYQAPRSVQFSASIRF
jgi:hypothetical protein